MRTSKLFTVLGIVALFATPAWSADPAPGNPARDPANQIDRAVPPIDHVNPGATHQGNAAGQKVGLATTFPVKSKLTGLNVMNSAGEKLGTVEDIVINLQDGKVQYLALSYGGVLGIGSKYFAVPFNEVRFNHGKDEMYFVLDVPKDKLQSAPGFDKSDWPDFADPKWRNEIETYYRTNNTAPGTANRPTTSSSSR